MAWGTSYLPHPHPEVNVAQSSSSSSLPPRQRARYEVISDCEDQVEIIPNNASLINQLLKLLKKNGSEQLYCYRCPCGELSAVPSKKVKIKIDI